MPVVLSKWLPDRKILFGGLSGVAAWASLAALAHWGIDPQPIVTSIFGVIYPTATVPDAQPLLAGLIGWGVAYWLSPTEKDIVKRINDDLAAAAGYLPATAKGTAKP